VNAYRYVHVEFTVNSLLLKATCPPTQSAFECHQKFSEKLALGTPVFSSELEKLFWGWQSSRSAESQTVKRFTGSCLRDFRGRNAGEWEEKPGRKAAWNNWQTQKNWSLRFV